MRRTTETLTVELAEAAEREARRRATSVSDVVRAALSTSLGLDGSQKRLPFADLGRSGTSNTASKMDELISKEWRH